MDSGSAGTAVAQLRAGMDLLAGVNAEALSDREVLGVLDDLETLRRRLPALEHGLLARLAAQASPIALGAKTMADVLAQRLRISASEARRRLAGAADLGPRRALTGQPLAPVLAATAAAQAAGQLNAEHVAIIRRFFTDLPAAVDHETREAAEATLAAVAAGQRPEGLRHAAHRLAALLDPDGALPDETDRARRRHLTLHRQGADGMSTLTGLLDPQARATLEAVFATLAAPGMANPDDPTPTVDGQPTDEQARRDTRSPAQRHHDALTAMGRALLASGQLGQHNGLPATIIVTTTLKELETAASGALRPAGETGHALTAAGTLLPMTEVIRLASHAHHYLVVFDNHRHIPLYLGRTKRLATPGQRIVLHARDRGCTKPGCTTGGYYCQVHHVNGWASQGHTNIDELTLACGPDNRLIETTDWTTHTRHDGLIEWLPPADLDTGQHRINHLHHPERLLTLGNDNAKDNGNANDNDNEEHVEEDVDEHDSG